MKYFVFEEDGAFDSVMTLKEFRETLPLVHEKYEADNFRKKP